MIAQRPSPLQGEGAGPPGRRRFPRWVHLAFWTALFYLLTYAVAKLAEWLSEV